MRYFIIFGITILLSLIILFYPRNYLLKFKDSITIDYTSMGKEELWSYEQNNDNLKLLNSSKNIWKFIPVKDGKTTLTYYYDRKDGNSYKYKIVYELVIKNNKIIWKSGSGFGLLEYPNPY